MILTPDIESKIVRAIEADPTKAVILPDHAYNKAGRVVVLVDGLSIDLHRHLHNTLIRPLGYHERMWNQSSDSRNINPHLFAVVEGKKNPRTHCNKGHEYEGNEAPPNSRRYRCMTCLRNFQKADHPGVPNKNKTHCPEGHEYTKANTIKGKDGRRRCLACKRNRNRAYMARKRKEMQ